MPINPELLDELLKEYKSLEDMFGTDGLLQQLTKALVERAMQAELTHHLGYEKHAPEGDNTGNSSNGSFPKTIKGNAVNSRSTSPATGPVNTNRSSSKKDKPVLTASMTKSFPCTRAA